MCRDSSSITVDTGHDKDVWGLDGGLSGLAWPQRAVTCMCKV